MRFSPSYHLSLNSPRGRTAGFVEDDYPPRLPVPSARRAVLLAHEESVHYAPAAPGAAALREWQHLSAAGDGNVRLGPPLRFFNTGFSYELHCARIVAGAVTGAYGPTPAARWRHGEREHVARCLNVLRQFALCDADVALEPPDALAPGRNYSVRGGPGGVRTCGDWETMYAAMEENWAAWKTARDELRS